MMANANPIDLATYFARIDHEVDRVEPTIAMLRQLHLKHPMAIPFENLDPFLRRPVLLDMETLQQKLVRSQRGGYCYEQNLLFMQVLRQLGFRVTGLAARVLWGRPEGFIPGRTHMLIRIDMADGPWIADVGFGGITLTAPLKLISGLEQITPHETFRLDLWGSEWVQSVRIGDEWRPVYRFGLEEYFEADYTIASHYMCSHPNSIFLQQLMAARPIADGRLTLLDMRLGCHGAESEKRELSTIAMLEETLEHAFGIDVPPGLGEALTRMAPVTA